MTPTKVKNVNFCLINNIIQYFLILFVISIIKFRGLTRRTLLLKKLNCGHSFITYIYTYIYVKYITSFIPQIIEFIKNILDKERAYLAKDGSPYFLHLYFLRQFCKAWISNEWGSVYFDVSKRQHYEKFFFNISKLNLFLFGIW